MELRYCEECGDVIRAEATDPLTIADRFVCDKCHGGATAEKSGEAAPSATETDFDSSRLNLFSPDTVAIHKRQYEEELISSSQSKSTRLRLVKEGASAEAEGKATLEDDGSTSRAKTAQKILFRCLHCKSTLSIRPVDRTSRLTCPHCGKAIYVTASGRLYKSSPPAAMKKGEGLLEDRAAAEHSGGSSGAKSGSAGLNLRAEAPGAPAGASATAVKKTSAGGSTAVKRTSAAGSTTLRSPTGAGSVALKKVGSQVAPKAQQSSRVVEGSRAQAALPRNAAPRGVVQDGKPAPTELHANPKAAPEPEGGKPVTGPTATQVGLTLVNPVGGWTPKPPSAFEEHQASQSPEKTVFITDEPTADLSALAGSNVLTNAGSFCEPEASDEKLAGLVAEGKGFAVAGEDLAKDLVASEEKPKESSPRAAVPFHARQQFTRMVVEGFVRAIFLTVFLCAPLFVVGGLLPPRASAEAQAHASPGSVPDFLQWLGTVAAQGIHKLVAAQKP